jgi:hypothetical protein
MTYKTYLKDELIYLHSFLTNAIRNNNNFTKEQAYISLISTHVIRNSLQ